MYADGIKRCLEFHVIKTENKEDKVEWVSGFTATKNVQLDSTPISEFKSKLCIGD